MEETQQGHMTKLCLAHSARGVGFWSPNHQVSLCLQTAVTFNNGRLLFCDLKAVVKLTQTLKGTTKINFAIIYKGLGVGKIFKCFWKKSLMLTKSALNQNTVKTVI